MLRLAAASIGPEEIAAMSVEDHRRAVMAFVAGLLADVDRYLRLTDVDPLRDGVSYQLAAMWLDDAEYADMLRDLVRLLHPQLAKGPRKGRRRRVLATVLLLGDDAAPAKERRTVMGEEVSFDSNGCSLAGTFTAAANPVAAAVVLAGSGRIDRDSDVRLPVGRMLRAGVTRAVADALARSQVTTLRYDKRGVGASGGDYLRAGMADRRADARAALSWLAGRAPALPLLAVGHSGPGTRRRSHRPAVARTAAPADRR